MDDQKKKSGHSSIKEAYLRFGNTIKLLKSYGGLPTPIEAKGLWDDLWLLETHHSTAIEGNTLVLKEVEKLLNEGRAVGSKALKDYVEVLGYGEAADWVFKQTPDSDSRPHDGLITLMEVGGINAMAMSKIWEIYPHPSAFTSEAPGSYREHDIKAFPGGMTSPTPRWIPLELSSWIDIVNDFGERVMDGKACLEDTPEELAFIHKEFERIHPFLDGNGRTGRLVISLILLRLGWPPAIIFKNQRPKYIRALDKADKGDCGPLAELLCHAIINSACHLIPNIAGLVKMLPLETLVDDDFILTALKKTAVKGRLEPIKGSDGH